MSGHAQSFPAGGDIMTTRDHPTGRWYVVAVHYPTALIAKTAWERANRKLITRSGDEGIGIVRMTPQLPEGEISSGAPPGVHPVVLITRDEATAHRAERILSDGTSWDAKPDFADVLIDRRVRVLLSVPPGQSGRLVIRRPEGRGARAFQGGILREPPPGKG